MSQRQQQRQQQPAGCLSLLLFAALLFLPFLLADALLAALDKLGLTQAQSLFAATGIFSGSLVNLPVRRIRRAEPVEQRPPMMFGLDRMLPERQQERQMYTIIAVNVGGCMIPVLIAAYELLRLFQQGTSTLLFGLLAVTINVAVCYFIARPREDVGITMPAFVPAIVAALSAVLLVPEMAPPVAFAAGVLGPLIGADFFHLNDLGDVKTGVASIGGAGTFDGIVLSGLVATLLA